MSSSSKSGALARGHHHQYIPPRLGVDSRSPCPALNSMANHQYLYACHLVFACLTWLIVRVFYSPHDGKRITFFELVRAQQEVYNTTFVLAAILALAGILVCGHWGTLTLSDLSAHNKIEHDGSMVHADASTGDATSVDSDLMNQLLSECTASKGRALSISDYIRAKVRRDAGLASPLDELHAEIARGEFGLTFRTFGVDKGQGLEISKERLISWFRDERLPDDWVAPEQSIGVMEAAKLSKAIKSLVEAQKRKLNLS